MVANLQTSIPPQDIQYGVEQVMSARLNFDSPATVNIGAIPAGAIVLAVVVATTTTFNAATTNTINVGFSDPTGTTANAYVAAQAIGPVGTVAVTMATTTNVPLSRPTTVTCAYGQTGTAATTGAAIVVVRFVVPR